MDETKLPEIEAKKLRESLEQDIRSCIDEVTEAINAARTGAVIDESEEPVRIATGKLRQKIFSEGSADENGCGCGRFFPLVTA